MLLSSWNWTQCSQPVRSRSRLVLNFINPKQGTCLVSNLALVPQRRNFAIWQRVLHRDRSESRPKNTVLSSVSISLGSDLKACFSASSNSRIFWRMGDSISQEVSGLEDTTAEERPNKIKLTDEEWKAKLSPEEYSVCRRHGTERAWTGALLENKKKGVYTCSCCGVELFSSSAKFDSGSGWPSFYDAMKDKDVSRLPAVDIKQDNSYGMMRTEVLCGKCSSHLGHVFNDGPKPTGLRYCINSVSLKFKAEKGDGGEGTSNGGTSKNNL